MATRLNDYLRANRPQGFRPIPHYFPSGDFLTYFVSNVRCRAERLDDVVTIYLNPDTGELVGCKVKGISHILKTADELNVQIECEGGGIRLGVFFLVGAVSRPDRETQTKKYKLLAKLADVRVDRSELALAK